jgi:hypothetical protein
VPFDEFTSTTILRKCSRSENDSPRALKFTESSRSVSTCPLPYRSSIADEINQATVGRKSSLSGSITGRCRLITRASQRLAENVC